MNWMREFINVYFLNMLELWVGLYFFHRFLGKRAALIHYMFFGFMVFLILAYFPWGEIGRLTLYIVLFYFMGRDFSGEAAAGSQPVLFYSIVTLTILYLCNGVVNLLWGIILAVISFGGLRLPPFVFLTVGFLLSLFLVILCYKFVDRYRYPREAGGGKYELLLLFPVLLILLVSEYIGCELSGSTITTDSARIVDGMDPWPLFTVQLLGIVSILGINYACGKLQEGFMLQKRVLILEQEGRYMEQYVEEAQMRYEKTRSLRHDIRNHITVMEELLHKSASGSRYGEAARYLKDMRELSEELDFPVSTGHPVLDILLGNKLGMAEAAQVQTKCTLAVPDPCGVTDIDFCIVLSNALDNAIAACGRMEEGAHRFIYVNSSLQGAFLLLQVENSCGANKEIQQGIGLANIRAVAEKYQGVMEIRTEDGVFVLTVLMNMEG